MASDGDVAHCHAPHGATSLWSACSAHWCELHQDWGEDQNENTGFNILTEYSEISAIQMIQVMDETTWYRYTYLSAAA